MKSFASRIEFEVIGCVDMFSSIGITPLATIGQTRIKIRLGRCINAAQLKASQSTLEKAQTMIVAADSGGQPAWIMLGSTAINLLL